MGRRPRGPDALPPDLTGFDFADYSLGSAPEDVHVDVDVPTYTDVHLRTELAGYVTTSLALIVSKGSGSSSGRPSLFRRRR
jgi:hypothetical protein